MTTSGISDPGVIWDRADRKADGRPEKPLMPARKLQFYAEYFKTTTFTDEIRMEDLFVRFDAMRSSHVDL